MTSRFAAMFHKCFSTLSPSCTCTIVSKSLHQKLYNYETRRQLFVRGNMMMQRHHFSNLIQDPIRKRRRLAIELLTAHRERNIKHVRNSRVKQRPSIKSEEVILAQQRSHAAQAILTLMHEREYFEDCLRWTMQALNVNLNINDISVKDEDPRNHKNRRLEGDKSRGEEEEQEPSRWENPGGQQASLMYRQMYIDSISSFCSLVVDQPSTINTFLADSKKRLVHTNSDLIQQPSATTVEDLLDQLIHIGFGDLHFIKSYKSMDQNRKTIEEYCLRLEEKKKLARIRDKQIETLKQDIKERHMKLVSSTIQDDADLEEHHPDSVLLVERSPQKQSRWAKQLEATLKKLDERQYELQTTTNQILQYQEKLDNLKSTLSHDDYVPTSNEVKDVLMKLCPAVAEYIRLQHKRRLDQYRTLSALTDLTKPYDWYPRARLDRRKIIFHGGPTNSGKTYNALQRLRQAKKGLYLAPLRLLATEVYETLTHQGIYTNLYTGQEIREVPFATHTCATVEMGISDTDYDVVLIDEIQMIADPFRGYAWTRALLGMRCQEIHLCGGMEAKSIVEKMIKYCGDELQIHEYSRFSDLRIASSSLASQPEAVDSYRHVQPGDCIVAFSRGDIFQIKREIESKTKHKCCIIYGSLPPETRTEQARRYNDPNSGYDILIASDAIGMGLNLNIRRMIFNSMFKSNGERIVQLDHSAVKQISGRAGRRNSPYPDGIVTCRDPRDMEHLRKCLSTDVPSIKKAGLLPTSSHIKLFANALEHFNAVADGGDLNRILRQFSEMATLQGDFFLCRQLQMSVLAKAISDLALGIEDKYTLCNAPVNESCPRSIAVVRKFAQKMASGEIPGVGRIPLPQDTMSFDDISRLCSAHSELELFLWLANTVSGQGLNLVEQQTAIAMKERVIGLINYGLAQSEDLKLDHDYLARDKNLRAVWMRRNKINTAEDVADTEFMPMIDPPFLR